MSLGDALVQSRNAPAIRLALQVGREALSGTAQAFGIYAHIDSPAAAIGAQETTNFALTQAYAALANGGMRVQGHIIANLEKSATIQVADPRTLETLTAMLHGVLAEGGTAQTMAPFAERMESRSYRVAGKTGTSSDFKDAWFVGFAGGIAVGVQIGFDQPRTMGTDAFGATVAGPVFAEIVDEAWRIGILKTQEGADEPK
jgi:penicillin-binding protein 1A